MPNMTVHVPSAAVPDLVAAVAQRTQQPVPPTTPEQLAMVTAYTQSHLQHATADYRSMQAGAAAHADTIDDDWTVA